METQTIQARVGEPVEIRRVAAGFGGGYIWRARLLDDSGGSVVEAENTEQDTVPGSHPVQVFVFRSTKPGIANLELSYGRPWEAAPIKTEIVRVEVS